MILSRPFDRSQRSGVDRQGFVLWKSEFSQRVGAEPGGSEQRDHLRGVDHHGGAVGSRARSGSGCDDALADEVVRGGDGDGGGEVEPQERGGCRLGLHQGFLRRGEQAQGQLASPEIAQQLRAGDGDGGADAEQRGPLGRVPGRRRGEARRPGHKDFCTVQRAPERGPRGDASSEQGTRYGASSECPLSLRFQTIAKTRNTRGRSDRWMTPRNFPVSQGPGERRLQVQQNSQPVLGLRRGGRRDGVPAGDEPIFVIFQLVS